MTVVMVMESDTKYTSTVSSNGNPNAPMEIKSEGVYTGPCKEGADTVEVAPGVKFDTKKMAEMAKAFAKSHGQ